MKDAWQDQDELEYKVERAAFFDLTNSIVDAQSAIKVLSVTVTAELGAFLMFYLGKDQVYEFLDAGENVWIYASVGVFVVGFMTAFAAFRMLPRRFPKPFFGYTIWLVSVIAGISNIGLFYFLLHF
jgi:hypothetical protein